MDLIFAEATPPGRGGVSIIRISGPGARDVTEKLAGTLSKPRQAYYRTLTFGSEELDQALVIRFEAGASFTGEESTELHVHGAPVVVRLICDKLSKSGARQAEAGEFTRRAFLNGRMDLAEIEGLGDLLEAETEAQRKLAARMAGGELRRKADHWRELLIRAGALVEASVDFADEDVPEDVPEEVFDLLRQLRDEIDREMNGFSAAERVRNGFEIAVVGPPNSGKSSLINKIAKREVALVSDIAGTTRDIIELRIDLKGLAVTFLDTAGLRETSDHVESLGVKRAKQRASAADLRLHLSETGKREEELWQNGDIVVYSKADLTGKQDGSISVVTGDGIDNLLKNIYNALSVRISGMGVISHQRQLVAISESRNSLSEIEDLPPELLAESIRQTAISLDRLIGRVGAEDYLDVIFSSFCIGK